MRAKVLRSVICFPKSREPGTCHNGPLGSIKHCINSRKEIMTVLLIDDEPEICFLMKNMLKRKGIICDLAHSLAQGRERLGKGSYSAVFLDIHLPDGKGYQLIGEIRQRQPGAQVIAISAVDAEKENAADRGADLFIAKPFDKSSILGGLQSLGITTD